MTSKITYKPGQKIRNESRLTFVKEVAPHITPSGQRKRKALFSCECGNTAKLLIDNAKRGIATSCGCFRAETTSERRTSHGMFGTPTYKSWAGMIQRCTNGNDRAFKYYGGRGITICDEWVNSFEAFYADMSDKPDNKTLDREDNEKGYSKDNCRWATRTEQNRNTRKNVNLTFNGKTQCVSAWAEDTGINCHAIYDRLRSGWSIGRALTNPIKYAS